MKKLMIAAFAVAFAAVAQAASISWSAYWVTDVNGNDLTTGAQAYLLTTAYAISDATAAFTAGTFDASNAVTSAFIAYNEDYGSHVNIGGVESALTGSQEFYMVLLNGTVADATQFMIVTDTVVTTMKPTGPTNVGFGELSDENTGASLYTWQPINAGAIPEPTSALMLLVGLAGLALKRKVA